MPNFTKFLLLYPKFSLKKIFLCKLEKEDGKAKIKTSLSVHVKRRPKNQH